MNADRPDCERATALYRVERTLLGDRLMPVTRVEDATHADIAVVRRLTDARAREAARCRADAVRAGQRIRDLETQVARAIHRIDQAEMVAAQRQEEITRLTKTRDLVVQKNAEVVGEKRRLRDALVGKTPLPVIHYRVDLDRDEIARETVVVTLDAFPHKERIREALAEARRQAARHHGELRSLRLDTSAWRAVIHRVIDE